MYFKTIKKMGTYIYQNKKEKIYPIASQTHKEAFYD